jgi:murein DD-endopeptidase MepM/ murein hydrolase activator NlpD
MSVWLMHEERGGPPQPTQKPRRLVWIGTGVSVLMAVLLVGVMSCGPGSPDADPVVVADAPPETAPPAPPVWPLARMGFPTPLTNLLDAPIELTIQPTESGRATSGLYGSVRTGSTGGRVYPSFHEGIDIKSVARDRHGKPLDEIYAVAGGRVGYVNRHSGNSNYGQYVVVMHEDAAGDVFTLYAHLAAVANDLRVGQAVTNGTPLGRMGNTPSRIIPMARAHLHFEVGILANNGFARWLGGQKTKNPHGNYNGWNLLACDPMAVLAQRREEGDAFSMLAYLRRAPVAFELIVRTDRLPDFFRRHAPLWNGDPFAGPAIVMACSESGVPLRGRNATPEEAALLKGKTPVVRNVDAAVLGRNGRRLIAPRAGDWMLGSQGQRWVDILLY